MVNPFSGIVSSEFKEVFNNAISALVDASGVAIPCTLYYGITRYESCANCLYDPIGKKSSNRYLNGGPVPFMFGGVCPLCNGAGKRPIETTEDVHLAVVFEPREFLDIRTPVNTADGFIQTIGKKEMTPKLRRANSIVVATNISGYFPHRYERVSEPTPMGLGNTEFVVCTWKRVG